MIANQTLGYGRKTITSHLDEKCTAQSCLDGHLDESSVCYENNTYHAYWLPRVEIPPAQPKSKIHTWMIMLPVFWD
ncbi:hypothetical protein KIN20_011640 [Parelaphostrongylus tenuis]|uniref:Uncharacterized protein n=1 Tax=Parelaphostrongylus tenuis TaxID=148309 RepID=A0AAD5MVB3_PARTN|nr:hypothetical protein KIN20_011640 [Parelaphostrongylus tenuis]